MDFVLEYLTGVFMNFDYHTQIFMCFAMFMAGLVAVCGGFLFAHYSNGSFGRLFWRLIGLVVLGAFSYVAAMGSVVGFQNYRVAKAETQKEAKIRQQVEKERYELLQSRQMQERARIAAEEAQAEAEKQLASNMVISAFDFVNGKGMFLQPDGTTTDVAPKAPEPVIETEPEPEFDNQGNSAAKQQLGHSLGEIERSLRMQLKSIGERVRDADAAYRNGQTTTYQQLLSKAKLEQEKNGYIVAAMEEKIAMLNSADYLSSEEKKNTMERCVTRRDAAATELNQYSEVEQLLINRKSEYEAL